MIRSKSKCEKSDQEGIISSEPESNDNVAADIIQYMFICDRKKIPIARADIVKHVMSGERRFFDTYFSSACDQIENLFGIKVIKTDDKAPHYILVNEFECDLLPLEKPIENDLINGLLIPVLSVIFMSEGQVKEAVIWNFLHCLGLDVDSKSPLPGIGVSTKELLTSVWVKQRYLQYVKIASGDTVEYVFRFGFRAEKQFFKMDLLQFVCDTMGGGMKPESWKLQYLEAQRSEEEEEEEKE